MGRPPPTGIFEVPDFLTKPEAMEILNLCEERMGLALDSQGKRRDGWEFDNLRFDPRCVLPWLEERVSLLCGGLDFDCVTDATALHYWAGSRGIPEHADHTHQTFYEESGRVMTMFIYLSDTTGDTGGTSFADLGLVAQPAFGKLVCFFPGALNGAYDLRLAHSGLATQDEKWLLRFFFHEKPLFTAANPFHEFDADGYAVRQIDQYDHECGRGAYSSGFSSES